MRSYTRVKDLLHGKAEGVVTIDSGARAQECAREMIANEVGSLLVLEGDKLSGILTWHDLLAALAEHGEAIAFVTAADLKTAALSTTDEDAELEQIEEAMTRDHIRHMPVLRGTEIVGVVTMIDVLRLHLQRSDAMSESLQDYITGVTH